MGKSHRDNTRARKKIGAVAFVKKAKRRTEETKCSVCGTKCRPQVLLAGVCPVCVQR